MWFAYQGSKIQAETYEIQYFILPGKNMLLTNALSQPCSSFNGFTDKDKALTNEVELLARSVVDKTEK